MTSGGESGVMALNIDAHGAGLKGCAPVHGLERFATTAVGLEKSALQLPSVIVQRPGAQRQLHFPALLLKLCLIQAARDGDGLAKDEAHLAEGARNLEAVPGLERPGAVVL